MKDKSKTKARLIKEMAEMHLRARALEKSETERVGADEALRLSMERLQLALDAANSGTWEWNVQTGETVFNDVWAQIIGYTLAELAPVSIKTWETFAHPDDLKRSRERLERHFAAELPYYRCECRMKHKDGHCIWVHDRGRVITRTGEGKPLMMFGTHTDITERKQVEQILAERTTQLEDANKELKASATPSPTTCVPLCEP